MAVNESILSVQNLSWSVGGKTILDQIDFEISAGNFVGLIGPNGAGKSSLLRALYRHIKPDAGTIEFQGRNIWHGSLRDNAKNIAVILQENHVPFGLRVRDVVAMGLAPHKSLLSFDSREDKCLVDQAIAAVDLTDLSNHVFSHLSGGEKQRVMVARAMVQRPKLLLMDEPTNHLDVHYQIEILQLAKELGVTVLASIHDLNLAAAFCDQLLVLERGCLIDSGTPQQVLTENRLGQTFSVCTLVDRHPLYDTPRVTFAYRGRHQQDDEHGGRQS